MVVYPVIIAIPFYISAYQIDLFQSYYESFSGFIGYGLSIFANPEFVNEPLLLWRSGSQWIGGFIFYLVSFLSYLLRILILFLHLIFLTHKLFKF